MRALVIIATLLGLGYLVTRKPRPKTTKKAPEKKPEVPEEWPPTPPKKELKDLVIYEAF